MTKKIRNLSEEEAKEMLQTMLEDTYTVVTWPEVQDLMEAAWFDEEAVLDVDCKFGDSAYLIPTHRLFEEGE